MPDVFILEHDEQLSFVIRMSSSKAILFRLIGAIVELQPWEDGQKLLFYRDGEEINAFEKEIIITVVTTSL